MKWGGSHVWIATYLCRVDLWLVTMWFRPVTFCSSKRNWKYCPYHRPYDSWWKTATTCWENVAVAVLRNCSPQIDRKFGRFNPQTQDGLKNVVEWGIANPHEAVMMASLNPAKFVHTMMFVVKSVKSHLTLTLSRSDKDLELVATYLDGAETLSGLRR